MTRGQRALHLRLWVVAAAMIAGLFAAALSVRERVQSQQESTALEPK